jgi:tRNA threonylcarbamoyladenosine biosynthesis protein TsaB
MAAYQVMLALETSGRRGSIALARGGEMAAFRWLSAERTHTSELMPLVQELLGEVGVRAADISLYCYSCGPGSFTGLRVAATVGRMLQSALGCQVVAVPTLEVIARNALVHPERPERLVAILDAKRGQVYGAVFQRRDESDLQTVVEAGIYDPAAWLTSVAKPFSIIGEGVTFHREACVASGGVILEEAYWPPSAEHVVIVGERLARAGCYCRPEQIVPLYLRPPECEEVYETRRAAARRRRGE